MTEEKEVYVDRAQMGGSMVLPFGIALMFVSLMLFVGYAFIWIPSEMPQMFGFDGIEYNETGYIEDIEFLDGSGFISSQTLIRFADGNAVTLQYRETEIPVKQNITLYYHGNGYGRYFLSNFTVLEGGERE